MNIETSDQSVHLRAQAETLAEPLRKKLRNAIKRAKRLIQNLDFDLEKHGDPERLRRFGELILANLRSARRTDDRIFVKDLYTEGEPEIAIEADKRLTITEIADDHFRRYTKARNAAGIIAERRMAAEDQVAELTRQLALIDSAVAVLDLVALAKLSEKPRSQKQVSKKTKQEHSFKGVRRFISSDGFEIWVGKKAADNDHLTFRISRSLETWLHTADYPGSHVVIRNSGKVSVPERTLLEAAQLAAFYSNAREHGKASVRYTQRKFVHKPKKAPAGMVSLSSFKTLVVEPGVNVKLKE